MEKASFPVSIAMPWSSAARPCFAYEWRRRGFEISGFERVVAVEKDQIVRRRHRGAGISRRRRSAARTIDDARAALAQLRENPPRLDVGRSIVDNDDFVRPTRLPLDALM